MTIEAQVGEILSFIFKQDIESITDLDIESVPDWDSMKHVALIAALENEFDVFIEVDQAAELTSFNKIVSFLK